MLQSMGLQSWTRLNNNNDERLGTCRKKMYVNSPTKFISHQKKICIEFPSVSNLLICLVTQIPFRKSSFKM